ncbi:MAG TPA: sodium-dependent transporter [Tissierellia bacterium]|nr:sodium-dependent transporter [Tissierellia bacterium]
MNETQERGQWSDKLGFLMAVIGSAVGLGNIWRYPYLLYKDGGGAFLVPYFVAIITAGIPLVLLEYGFGHKFRGSAPLSYTRANRKFEWIGWVPAFASMVILSYYCVILSWAFNYLIKSFSFGWTQDPNAYFFDEFLGLSSSPFDFSGFSLPIMVGIVLIWGINWYYTYRGVSSGIEKVNKFMMPALVTIMVIIVIRGVTLEGATLGLNALFTPDFSRLGDIRVWLDAYGQVFFSLSLAMGALITYASYLPRKTDLNNSAFITAFANCGFEFLAAIGVFGILGYMATQQNVPIDDVVTQSVGLAFVAFPQVLLLMGPFWGKLMGVLFFTSLIFAGITSSLSLIETFTSSFIDKTGIERKKVATVAGLIGLASSLAYASGAGLYLLDIIDHYVNAYVIVTLGMVEAILIGWVVGASKMRAHANEISYIRLGAWWEIMIKFVTPIVLFVMLALSIVQEIRTGYEGYPTSALLLYGVLMIVIAVVFGIVMQARGWNNPAMVKYDGYEHDYYELEQKR